MRTGLGRGLDVLLGERASVGATPSDVSEIPLEKVAPNPQQPRQTFPPEDLAHLAASIKRHGVLQPIVVSRAGDSYQLIAGHRRVLASRLAGRTAIPAVVRNDVTDRLELALIENVQRADLTTLEVARAYRVMLETYGMTQTQLAERVGKDPSTVSNILRVLEAPLILQEALADGKISEGHIRALVRLRASDLPVVLAEVVAKDLSVRDTEDVARRIGHRKKRLNGRARANADPELDARTADLRSALGTKVEIQRRRKGGRISLEFYSNDDFERLYELLMNATK